MLKIDEATIKESTWNKADANEPVFVLRGQDRLAPWVVRFWALLALLFRVDRLKIKEALRLARAMQSCEDRKTPD